MLIYLAMQDTSCERDRLAEIYEKYKNQMFALANSILGDVRDSEDVVHEAFVAMIPYIDRLPEEAAHPKVRAFALTLAESKRSIFTERESGESLSFGMMLLTRILLCLFMIRLQKAAILQKLLPT